MSQLQHLSTSGRFVSIPSCQPVFATRSRVGGPRSPRSAACPQASASGASSSGSSRSGDSSGSGNGRRRSRKAKQPGVFEVQDVSPPPRSLGIHFFPANTGNGDWVEVSGANYIVQSVVLQYKLVRGRYERDHQRLEVQHTGRVITEMYLDSMLRLDGPRGRQ